MVPCTVARGYWGGTMGVDIANILETLIRLYNIVVSFYRVFYLHVRFMCYV